MAVLHIHKCVGCGYTIWSSKGGDYNLMCGPGHFYICPQCKVVFPKSWVNMDICLTTEACSYAEDVHFADLLAKTVPDDLQEIVLKDVKWFQGEVMKGDKSKYYGQTLTHDAVRWTKQVFWNKLFKYLLRKDYGKSIRIDEIRTIVEKEHLVKYARYTNNINNVKCSHCNGQALMWRPLDGCPKCGNVLELDSNNIACVD